MNRIGIFAGSFNPVHKGHITFALKAVQQAKLDEIHFLPEINPRGKADITHIGHRVAMLRLALAPYSKLHILEVPDAQFSVARTWPKLKKKFPGDRLFLLLGSNTVNPLAKWPFVKTLLNETGLVVALNNGGQTFHEQNLPLKPQELYVLPSSHPNLSSTRIRTDLLRSKKTNDLLPSLRRYVKANWLYSLAVPKSSA